MKFLLTAFLFILSVSLFSLDSDKLFEYSTPINLTQGIQYPELKNINDFTNIPENITPFYSNPVFNESKEAIVPFNSNSFYNLDFNEDPFNGCLELAVIGEPCLSVNLTLLISGLFSILSLQYKSRVLDKLPKIKALQMNLEKIS